MRNTFVDKGINNVNLFFIVGADRADFADTIINSFKDASYIKTLNAKILPRPGMQKLLNQNVNTTNINEIPMEQYSASFVRNLVKNNQREEFELIYRPYL